MPSDMRPAGKVPPPGPASPPPAPSHWPDGPAKSREEFADRLRDLRVQAGSPSFRQLAKLTSYSASTLSDATNGRRLPTEPVLKALVGACGADAAPWLEELRRLTVREARASLAATDQPASGDRPGTPGTGPARRWAVLAAGAIAVLGAGMAAGYALAPASSAALQAGPGVPAFSGTPVHAPAGQVVDGLRIVDGIDPSVGHCEADARLVDRAPVMRDGHQIAALDLLYSPACGAGWASLYLYPGEPVMMGEVTVRAGDGRYVAFSNPLVKQVNDYTDVIVPGTGGCLGAYAQVYQAGMPVITASLPCEAPAGRVY